MPSSSSRSFRCYLPKPCKLDVKAQQLSTEWPQPCIEEQLDHCQISHQEFVNFVIWHYVFVSQEFTHVIPVPWHLWTHSLNLCSCVDSCNAINWFIVVSLLHTMLQTSWVSLTKVVVMRCHAGGEAIDIWQCKWWLLPLTCWWWGRWHHLGGDAPPMCLQWNWQIPQKFVDDVYCLGSKHTSVEIPDAERVTHTVDR